MGMFDNLKTNKDDFINSSSNHSKIIKIAKEKGISLQSARQYFIKHGGRTED